MLTRKHACQLHENLFHLEGYNVVPKAVVIHMSCFQVAIWLKYRWRDVNPHYNQPTNQVIYMTPPPFIPISFHVLFLQVSQDTLIPLPFFKVSIIHARILYKKFHI